MTAPDTVIWNTLEEVSGSDLNAMGGYASKAVLDSFLASIVDPKEAFTTKRSLTQVRRGLNASPGGGLALLVSAGEGMVHNGGVSFASANSPLQLGRMDSDTEISLGTADATNPRVVLVTGAITSDNPQHLVVALSCCDTDYCQQTSFAPAHTQHCCWCPER